MSNDLVADMLTHIRNAQGAGHHSVRVRSSNLVESVLSVLKREGFIDSYESVAVEGKPKLKNFEVRLRYYDSGEPMIRMARKMSSSGRRMYSNMERLPRVSSGLGITIVSTSQGVMSDREARKKHVGGEVLALIG